MRTPWKQNAAHCLEAVRATTNPEIRAMLLAMAEQWSRRAEKTEESDPRAPSLETSAPTAR
jgi:hypothetical protein